MRPLVRCPFDDGRLKTRASRPGCVRPATARLSRTPHRSCSETVAAALRSEWWVYVGSHAVHAVGLIAAAARHRRGGGSFTAASRYGGTVGYATLAILGATAYAPGGRPPADLAVRRLHRAGEHVLFGLYAFTIVHGYQAKGRNLTAYGPLAALWAGAAVRGAERWSLPPATTGELR